MNFKRKGDLDAMSVIDYEAFKFYRENSKLRNTNHTNNYVEHGKILSAFYKRVGEKIPKSSGGVFIEGLGYFGGVIDMHKKYTGYFGRSINLNRITSGYKFFLIFIPISKDNALREWVADSNFTSLIKGNFSKALKNGIKFKFSPYYFIKKYGHKTKRDE